MLNEKKKKGHTHSTRRTNKSQCGRKPWRHTNEGAPRRQVKRAMAHENEDQEEVQAHARSRKRVHREPPRTGFVAVVAVFGLPAARHAQRRTPWGGCQARAAAAAADALLHPGICAQSKNKGAPLSEVEKQRSDGRSLEKAVGPSSAKATSRTKHPTPPCASYYTYECARRRSRRLRPASCAPRPTPCAVGRLPSEGCC